MCAFILVTSFSQFTPPPFARLFPHLQSLTCSTSEGIFLEGIENLTQLTELDV
jgi:hypothetical protein